MPRLSVALPVVMLAGAAAGWLAGRSERPQPARGQPSLHRMDFHVDRKPDDPIEVTPAKWLSLPYLFGDFDLHADVELAEDTDLDLLLRKVEPRPLGSQALPFHGRFQVLRLSTRGEAAPFRTRFDALLGPPGGVSLAAGLVATVAVEARGRRLSVNVAGKRLPEVLADDEHGSFAMVAHGGKAVVRGLHIVNRTKVADGMTDVQAFFADPAWSWRALLWPGVGALAALLAALVGAWRCVPASHLLFAVPVLPIASGGAAALLFAGQLPLLQPDPGSVALATVAGVPWLLLLVGRGPLRWAVALPAALVLVGALWQARRVEAARSAPAPELDLLFGPAAGETIAEALAARVRGPREIHVLEPHQRRVFLLGGQQLWDRAGPDEHLELLLRGELRHLLGGDVDVPCLPTVDGWTGQQLHLFAACYQAYRPQVLVLGVPRDEAAPDADGNPRSDAGSVRGAIAAAEQWCREHGGRLVVVADAGLPAELLAVVREVAAGGIATFEFGDRPPAELARGLAPVIAGLLKP